MINAEPTQPPATLPVEQTLQLALANHQAGKLQEAGQLYNSILQTHPHHPEANHNMGVLAVQMKQPAAGLPYFLAALDADPARGQYWLGYIDALFQAGQPEDARQVLALARQQGLQGDEVDTLARRLESGPPALPDNGKPPPQTKSAGKPVQHKGKNPSPQEISTLQTLFNQGRLREAAALARTMTVRYPMYGFGWTVLGAVYKQMGQSANALAPMQQAVALLPNDANAHNNLGATLQDLGRPEEASACLMRAIKIKPDFAQAHYNLGVCLQKLGRLGEAETSIRRALQIKPDFADAYNNLGIILHDLGRRDEAEASFRRALQINPDCANVHSNLGTTLHDMGRMDDALAHFQQQAELTPENAVAQHLIASMTGKNTERAPDQYIESVFDGYAEKFDAHLLKNLKYETPNKLVSFITRHSAPPGEKWNVLDLGCGTGLAGVAIAPFARQLVGVDLSARMLDKARERNLYQRLERLDLLTMMRDEQAHSYDVIIAADVFVYLGKLDEIVSETRRLLCPGGIFAFSVEALDLLANEETNPDDQREYQLGASGRYAHTANYLNRLASAHGFLIQEMAATQIREERNQPVKGYLVLWQNVPAEPPPAETKH
ncbi:MAG: tetratricopeptide repeat protein [Nitrosomonadales bacterium]|nr:tetratricopeptide repeat protein [Nitrosomonadales bacterium]